MSIRAHTTAQRLDALGDFQRPVLDTNGDVISWTTVARGVRMAVDGAKASERQVADGTRSVNSYTVWVRSDIVERFDIRQNDRIVTGGEWLDIKSAPRQGLQGRMIPLGCEAGVNRG